MGAGRKSNLTLSRKVGQGWANLPKGLLVSGRGRPPLQILVCESSSGSEMGLGDAIVPGELVFVEIDPSVAEAERDEGES
jgi:hypothetical protein